MATETPNPADPQRRLLELGIPMEHINFIQTTTADTRETPEPFRAASQGLYSGNYASALADSLRIISPSPRQEFTTTTQSPLTMWEQKLQKLSRGRIQKKPHKNTTQETKELFPVNIVDEIASYVRTLSEKGENPIRIVDFGAGSATTMCQVAQVLENEIKEGKVTIEATNINAMPSPLKGDDRHIQTLRKAYPVPLREAREKETVTFSKKDILELYQGMNGKKVHLFFAVNTFPFTQDYNDTLLTVLSDLLDPENGTAVLGLGSVPTSQEHSLFREQSISAILDKGLRTLKGNGFKKKNIFDVTDQGTLRMPHIPTKNIFEVYQGKNAPDFNLYQV